MSSVRLSLTCSTLQLQRNIPEPTNAAYGGLRTDCSHTRDGNHHTLILSPLIQEGWIEKVSKSRGKVFYFNTETKESVSVDPVE